MPVYEYRALNAKGRRVSGIVDAESPVAARQKLRISGIFPVSISECAPLPGKKDAHSASSILALFGRIRASEIAVITRGLATLLGAGFPLVAALETLVSQTKTATLKKVLAKVKDLVVEGNSFAFALSQFPGVFPPLYVNMAQAGEASGTLEIVLERLADMMEKQMDLGNRIRSALTYPIFMALLGCAVLFFLMTVIVPNIAAVFAEMGRALPAPTRLLIAASDLLKSFWWLFLVLLGGGTALFVRAKKTVRGREFLDGMTLRMPVVGPLVIRLATARFARTLGSLLENGVPLLKALDIVQNIVARAPLSKAVRDSRTEVEKGRSLADALVSHGVFPDLFVQMVKVGEQSGKLEAMLEKTAGIYEREVTSQVTRMTSLLEPVMILVMGVIVGGIVVSICLPIFEMNQLVF